MGILPTYKTLLPALLLLAFLGGFSAATSMVIVATIALSTMVSNHVVMPLWLSLGGRASGPSGLRGMLLMSRRLSIIAILGLGYLYFLVSAPRALAAIGLISFAGMAQVAPSLFGGLFWRGATRTGALAGLTLRIDGDVVEELPPPPRRASQALGPMTASNELGSRLNDTSLSTRRPPPAPM